MKEFLNGIVRVTGDQWFGFLVICFCAAVSVLVINLAYQDHKVRCYYMKTYSTNAGLAYQVMGDVDWSEDIKSFSTPDPDKALSVIGNLKQCASD